MPSSSLLGRRILTALSKQWRLFGAMLCMWFVLLVALMGCEYLWGTTQVETYAPLSSICPSMSLPGYSVSPSPFIGPPFILRVSVNGGSLMYVYVEKKPWRDAIGNAKGVTWCKFAGDCVYLMAISFTTIGFGDVVPSHPSSRAICVASGMLGMFVFGVIVAIAYEKTRFMAG